MPSELKIDDKAFRDGLAAALVELEDDGVTFLEELAGQAANYARARAPRGATGAIVAGIGVRRGSTDRGPWVEVGVIDPPESREDFYMEFGTYKDRPRPFMRPALASIAAGIRQAGGSVRRSGSARSRGIAQRTAKRAVIRSFRRKGTVTTAQARLASRAVSQRFRLRRPRRR